MSSRNFLDEGEMIVSDILNLLYLSEWTAKLHTAATVSSDKFCPHSDKTRASQAWVQRTGYPAHEPFKILIAENINTAWIREVKKHLVI